MTIDRRLARPCGWFADEIAMPLMSLSRSTLRRPVEMHLQSFAAHLVFGIVTERLRRVVRSLLPPPRPRQ